MAVAHNGNMSNGVMFPVEVNPATGKKLNGDYAEQRARWEPLYEVTHIKGMAKHIRYFRRTTSRLGQRSLTIVFVPNAAPC